MNGLIIGSGFLGGRVALSWQKKGWRVFSFTRDKKKKSMMGEFGISFLGDDFQNLTLYQELPKIDYVLVSVALEQSAGNGPSKDGSVFSLAGNVCEALVIQNRSFAQTKFIFTSTTGVYGTGISGDLSPISENHPVEPTRPGAIASYELEKRLSSFLSHRLTILRLAGHYHRLRMPGRKQLETGQLLQGDPFRLLNLIHVDDIVQIISRLCSQWPKHRVFNLSDGHAIKRVHFYQQVAEVLGLEAPKFEGTGLEGPGFYGAPNLRGTGRPMDNSLIKQWLGDSFQFRQIKEGLMHGSKGLEAE